MKRTGKNAEKVVGANGRTTLVSRFTHIAYIAERVPVEGCFVRFETAPSTQGRPDRAINVEYYETEAAPDPAPTVDVLSGKDDATC